MIIIKTFSNNIISMWCWWVTYDGDRCKLMLFEGKLKFKENQCHMSEVWSQHQFFISHDSKRFKNRNQEINMIELQKYSKTFIVKLLFYMLVSKHLLVVSGVVNARGMLKNQLKLFFCVFNSLFLQWIPIITCTIKSWKYLRDDIIFQQNAKEHVMLRKVVRKLHKDANFPFHLRVKHLKVARNLR